MLISLKRWELAQTCLGVFWIWQLPSFGDIEGEKIENVNISETMRTSAKMNWTDFYRFWYLPSNDNIARLIPNDLDLLFEGQQFEILISRKQWQQAQTCAITFKYLAF